MKNKKIKIGIIGCGTIGRQLAQAVENKFAHQARLCALCDTDSRKLEQLQAKCSSRPQALSLDKLIASCDLIIEAASATVAYEVASKALQRNKDVMIMSVGGILNDAEKLFALARKQGRRLYLPSGAVCGLDAVGAAAMARIDKATLVTRKPPAGLKGAPYLAQHNLDLDNIKQETVVFNGSAEEAIQGFPKNVNVCATLSLAGIGAQKTQVQIITAPDYRANIHELQVEGDFGKLVARTENRPSPQNPKTSYLASLSAIATLKNILDVVKIGT